MLINLKIEGDLLRKIEQIIKDSGEYNDENEFIIRAIKNQIIGESDNFEKEFSQDNLESPISNIFKNIQASINPEKARALEQLDKASLVPVFPTEILYGPPYGGLIWLFHNRFLPVKIILCVLGEKILATTNQWITIDSFREEIANIAPSVGEILSTIKIKDNDLSIDTGFPTSLSRLKKRHEDRILKKIRGKANKENWLHSRMQSSRKRFLDQFVGKPIVKEHVQTFSGACFEMGLINVKEENGEIFITISKTGLEFALIENQIIKTVFSEKESVKEIKQVFSDKEKEFIIDNIISKYSIEKELIHKVVESGDELILNTTKIQEILFKLKKQFLVEHYKDAKELKEKLGEKTNQMLKENSNIDAYDYAAEKDTDIQSAAILRRLVELGILNLKIVKNVPKYTKK